MKKLTARLLFVTLGNASIAWFQLPNVSVRTINDETVISVGAICHITETGVILQQNFLINDLIAIEFNR